MLAFSLFREILFEEEMEKMEGLVNEVVSGVNPLVPAYIKNSLRVGRMKEMPP
jgi:hypothetical protein